MNRKEPNSYTDVEGGGNQLPLKDNLVFVRHKKLFQMEKNKKRLRIIGNGNKVVIACNTGHVDVSGDSISVWITRNSGSVHFTGNNGRVFLGDQSEVRVVDYEGAGGRVTVLEECHMIKQIARDRNKRKESETEKNKSKVVEEEAFKEIVVRKDYLIPIIHCRDSITDSVCIVQVTSEIIIKTNIVGELRIDNSKRVVRI